MDHKMENSFVNDLFEKFFNNEPGIVSQLPITIYQLYDILCICHDLTKDYPDESHNLQHHLDVFGNAMHIYSDIGIQAEWKNDAIILITYATLLHDTIDRKYPKNMETKIIKLHNFIETVLPKKHSDNVMWIMKNISYSTEVKNGYPVHNDPLVQLVRDIVSDADKIEALGEMGLKRCREYTKSENPELSYDEIEQLVLQHCHDKLLKLKDQYIRTIPGKKIAEPVHKIIVDYANNAALQKI